MKGKRQTIWLVSMLSLMVVLSAYYLFTEDSGASVPQETAGSIQVDNLKETGANSSVLDNGLVINEVDTKDAVTSDAGTTGTADDSTAVTADDSTLPANAKGEDADKTAAAKDDKSSDSKTAAADTSAAAGKDTAAASTEKTPAKGDDEILDEVASQSVSASSLFNNYLYEREQQNLKNYNDLLALINDMDKTPAENAVAHEQLNKLEEKETKITGIEEQLQKKYGEAIVKEESGDAYTVVVLSEKLDVKQAVGIVDLVMKELSVSQDKIRVQYVSEQ
ncbi:SpoIIIAH-like family protein [Paenibacillus sp. FSL M7-1046]|uniref:SpoIIIAH-like family protein n=1 Tax=Paenibacillus sp. FSL M7-1046 TaxID=2975315 RepID=UPI0030F4F73E